MVLDHWYLVCAQRLHYPVELDLTDINKELPEKNKLTANLQLSESINRHLADVAAKFSNNR